MSRLPLNSSAGQGNRQNSSSSCCTFVNQNLEANLRMAESAESRSQNKDKPKKGRLPAGMMEESRYLAAKTVTDVWICYPWEAT